MKTQSLDYDVIPGVGAGPFKIDMTRGEVLITLQDIDETINTQNIENIETDNFNFSFTEKGIFSSLAFGKNFKEKIFGKVGFGDPVDLLLPAETVFEVVGYNPKIKGLTFMYYSGGLYWMCIFSADIDILKESHEANQAYFDKPHEDDDETP